MVLAWVLSGSFCDIDLYFVVVAVLHLPFYFIRIFFFDIIPHPSVDYRQVFRPILYFQPSPSQSVSSHFHFSTIPLSSYCERYGFEWAFFTHRRFLPYAPSPHFGTTCFYQGFARSWQLLFWKLQGFILILETQT